MNKIDLLGRAPAAETVEGKTVIWLSAKTGAGIDLLREALLKAVGWHSTGEGIYLARERHLQALDLARECLQRAAERVKQPELFAEELRLAQEALSSITGEFTADDLLGEIFSRFCIGK
jgi:tRNA modification GTPase